MTEWTTKKSAHSRLFHPLAYNRSPGKANVMCQLQSMTCIEKRITSSTAKSKAWLNKGLFVSTVVQKRHPIDQTARWFDRWGNHNCFLACGHISCQCWQLCSCHCSNVAFWFWSDVACFRCEFFPCSSNCRCCVRAHFDVSRTTWANSLLAAEAAGWKLKGGAWMGWQAWHAPKHLWPVLKGVRMICGKTEKDENNENKFGFGSACDSADWGFPKFTENT